MNWDLIFYNHVPGGLKEGFGTRGPGPSPSKSRMILCPGLLICSMEVFRQPTSCQKIKQRHTASRCSRNASVLSVLPLLA